MNFMPARRVSLLIASKFVVGLMMVCWSSVVGISVSHASDPRPQLHKSMSYYEVVKLWGAPVEKHEYESKREDIWEYADAKVIFHGGKVAAWTTGVPGAGGLGYSSLVMSGDQSITGVDDPSNTDSIDEFAVEEILTEILDEAPGGKGQR